MSADRHPELPLDESARSSDAPVPSGDPRPRRSADRKGILLRLDPAVHDALARWAAAELRSTNAQIEFLLREALRDVGRLPSDARAMRRPGRPRANPTDSPDTGVPDAHRAQRG
jgi:hypothetical protein